MKRKSKLTIAIATAVLAVLGAVALYAQDKYTLKSPSGIAFSDFRGYEDWSVVSSAKTDERLKVIVANPTMIKAYKAGIPGNGQPFPDGSMIVKLQWKPKKSTEAPFVVDVPDVFVEAFVIEKDGTRFPKSAGMFQNRICRRPVLSFHCARIGSQRPIARRASKPSLLSLRVRRTSLMVVSKSSRRRAATTSVSIWLAVLEGVISA
jgi:Cytochrome P460